MSMVGEDRDSFAGNAYESAGEHRGLSRRALLKGTAGAIVAATGARLAGAIGTRAQVEGLEPGPEVPSFRLPMASLTYLDQKQYIHNMEILGHLSGSTISGGEPLRSGS
jgi:hypothetical protein